jgi:hypothetical protein
MSNEPLYYVAPETSKDYILRNGIFSPREVNRLIQAGELSDEVLGISFGGNDSSNFPEFVSMVGSLNIAKLVAQQLSFSRTGQYKNPDFVAIGYEIRPEIRDHQNFIGEKQVKQMNPDCYPSEVLFRGNIGLEFLLPRYFGVRP